MAAAPRLDTTHKGSVRSIKVLQDLGHIAISNSIFMSDKVTGYSECPYIDTETCILISGFSSFDIDIVRHNINAQYPPHEIEIHVSIM